RRLVRVERLQRQEDRLVGLLALGADDAPAAAVPEAAPGPDDDGRLDRPREHAEGGEIFRGLLVDVGLGARPGAAGVLLAVGPGPGAAGRPPGPRPIHRAGEAGPRSPVPIPPGGLPTGNPPPRPAAEAGRAGLQGRRAGVPVGVGDGDRRPGAAVVRVALLDVV